MLHEFLDANGDQIVALARAMAGARPAPKATAELNRGIPLFMKQLIDALRRSGSRNPTIAKTASMHGAERLSSGFTYAQVVQDYGNVCQAITKLAHEMNAPITADEFRTLNRCLDEGIAAAITEYGRLREQSIDNDEERYVGMLSLGLRTPLDAATLAYQSLRTGTVGIGGSTGAELDRNLRRISSVIDRTMARVRLDAGVQSPERLSVFTFIEELEVGASMDASALDLELSVAPVEHGVDVEVDRQLATAAVASLLQNAFQFTRPKSRVALNTSWTTDRVAIDVEDECGGLPARQVTELSRAFAQRGADRSGLGVGLSIGCRSAEAIGGEIRVRDMPGTGCVFTIALPRRRSP